MSMKRSPSAASPDRRVRRSRKLLRTALVTLILERGWDEVSVQDVCAQADVGRSTFYLHFADKEDLLLSGFDELHASLGALPPASGPPFGFAETLVEHARSNTRLYRALVGKKSGRNVLRRFHDVVLRLVEADVERLGVAPSRREPVSRYVAGGFLELLTAWLDRPSLVDPATLAPTFHALTDGVLDAAGVRRR